MEGTRDRGAAGPHQEREAAPRFRQGEIVCEPVDPKRRRSDPPHRRGIVLSAEKARG
jgi:hypothetical protein